MYKLRFIILLGMMGSTAMAGDYYRCYEYKADDFIVKPALAYERVFMAIPRVWPEKKLQPLILLLTDESGRYEKMSQYLGCEWNSTVEKYRCGGECDAGVVMMGQDMSLRFNAYYKLEVDIPVDKTEEEKRAGLDLAKNITAAKAKPIACPLYVEKFYDASRDGDSNSDPLLSVCYMHKGGAGEELSYGGCMMSAEICGSIGKRHFGRYQSEEAAYKAFLRCVDAKPLR